MYWLVVQKYEIILILSGTCAIFIIDVVVRHNEAELWRVFAAFQCVQGAEGVRQEAANLSGKRTEHEKCMFYSLEELMKIGSFFLCKNDSKERKNVTEIQRFFSGSR